MDEESPKEFLNWHAPNLVAEALVDTLLREDESPKDFLKRRGPALHADWQSRWTRNDSSDATAQGWMLAWWRPFDRPRIEHTVDSQFVNDWKAWLYVFKQARKGNVLARKALSKIVGEEKELMRRLLKKHGIAGAAESYPWFA